MTSAASGTLEGGAKIQYLSSLVRIEVLCWFYSLSDDVERMQTWTVDEIIKRLAQYFPPVNFLFKNSAPCAVKKKARVVTVRRYVACLIDINDFFFPFPGDTLNDKISLTKLNEILLNSMPNNWYKLAYVQGFYCESITFKIFINMFGCMEIPMSIS